MNYETAYNKAVEVRHRDIGLLFQRLNFFLIATAFLIAAFATVLTVGTDSKLIRVDYALTLVGFVFSLVYATTNYLNTRIIRKINDYIRELEGRDFSAIVEQGQGPYQRIDEIAQQEMKRGKRLLLDMLISALTLVYNPRGTARESVADHTYLIPLLFAGVWLGLFIWLFFLI